MLADISHGHVDAADWLFLIAAIVFVIAALVRAFGDANVRTRLQPITLIAVGLALMSFAWVLL